MFRTAAESGQTGDVKDRGDWEEGVEGKIV
jgi:hypothetical protein